MQSIDRVSGCYEFKKNKIHEFYWILNIPTEFYLEILYFNFDWKLQSRFFAVTETLNSDESDSNQQRSAILECFR